MQTIILQFIAGFILYGFMACFTYSEGFKTSMWYYPAGILCSALATVIWFTIAFQEKSSSALMLKGLYWDVMLTMVYMIIPMTFFSAKFTSNQAMGIALIVTGIVFTKI